MCVCVCVRIYLYISEFVMHRRYMGTSLMKESAPLGPYSRPMLKALWWSWGGAFSYEPGTHVQE